MSAFPTLIPQMIGVYVSAGWCPPCRAFSPVLSKWAKEHKDEFEVVFVSLDKRLVRYPCLYISRGTQRSWEYLDFFQISKGSVYCSSRKCHIYTTPLPPCPIPPDLSTYCPLPTRLPDQRARNAQLHRWKRFCTFAVRAGIRPTPCRGIFRCPSAAHPCYCKRRHRYGGHHVGSISDHEEPEGLLEGLEGRAGRGVVAAAAQALVDKRTSN